MRRRRDERGAVAIIVAVVMSALLFSLCAIVVDLGLARERKQESQVNSDAAALAAANALYLTGGSTGCTVAPCFAQAVAAAQSYTIKNLPGLTSADWAACSDPGHYYVYSGTVPSGTVTTNCISFADDGNAANSTQPTKVRVVTPLTTVKAAFGGAVGVNTVTIQTAARAKLQPGMNRSCGLCLLGAGVSNVGNGDVTVYGASVHTNGKFDVGPGGQVTVSASGGTITAVNGCTQNCTPAATYAPAISDPYATAVALPPSDMPTTPKSGNPCVSGPGVYTGTVSIPNSACELPSGMYVIANMWQAGNNTNLTSAPGGVTLYFTCKSGTTVVMCGPSTNLSDMGSIDMKNGNATLVGMTTGSLKNFVIAADRNNTAALTLQGNGVTKYTGTIYAPQAQLTFPGTTCMDVVNGPIIVGSLYSNGNTACMDLTDANGANIPMPPGAPNLDQ